MIRVADYIVDRIYQEKVNEVFMVSGGGMMFLSDAVLVHPKIKVICNHHEQASAMAAVAYAKYNNNFGAAFITTGCGGVNALTGVLNAWQDSIPCIFISGQVKKENTTRNSGLKLRQFGVQEFDIITAVESFTKYAVMVNDPNEIAYEIDKAIYLAKSGRPGPVWLDIPTDVQSAKIDPSKLRRFSLPKSINDVALKNEQFKELEKMLLQAKRPMIVLGQGVRLANASNDFKKFIERHKIPVVASYLGVGILPTEHPLFIGRLGSKGDRPGNFSIQNADLVLSIGCRLSVTTVGYDYSTFIPNAKLVVVDIDEEEHKKKARKIDLFINIDAKKFLNSFKTSKLKTDLNWIKTCQKWKKQWPVCLSSYYVKNGRVNLYYFVDRLSGLMKSDSVVVSDAGSAFYVTTQGIKIKNGQRYITSGGQAEMGFTIPAIIGVSSARNHKEVLGITGDGSFQMNIQELQTIKHNKLPVKMFVWNNDGYLSIRATQKKLFDSRIVGSDSKSGVSFPNLKKIAKAYGIKYYLIKNNHNVDQVVKKVLAEKQPIICEVLCLRDQEIVPTVAPQILPDGKIVSNPIQNMYPFLKKEEIEKNMLF